MNNLNEGSVRPTNALSEAICHRKRKVGNRRITIYWLEYCNRAHERETIRLARCCVPSSRTTVVSETQGRWQRGRGLAETDKNVYKTEQSQRSERVSAYRSKRGELSVEGEGFKVGGGVEYLIFNVFNFFENEIQGYSSIGHGSK